MKTFSPKNLTRQAGVSLAETMIVTVVIGALSVLSYSQFGNSSALVKARTTVEISKKVADSWSYIAGQLDTPVTLTTPSATAGENQVLSNNSTALDLVVNGDYPAGILRSGVRATYVASGIKPLSDIVKAISKPVIVSGGTLNNVTTASSTTTAGSYSINGYPISLGTVSNSDGALRVKVGVNNVPSEVASAIWSAFYPGITYTSAKQGYDTNGNIQNNDVLAHTPNQKDVALNNQDLTFFYQP